MTLHRGLVYTQGDVSLRPPDPDAIRAASIAPDVREPARYWLAEAEQRENVYYFSIYQRDTLVGQILLHDTNRERGETLIGYHLFEPRCRGQGIGTAALSLLVQFLQRETEFARWIIITSRDNIASQRIARKCGFRHIGPSREDPANGMVFERTAPPSTAP